MNASQKLKHLILLRSADFGAEFPDGPISSDNIDAIYEKALENDDGSLQDARSEIRCSGQNTHLAAPSSRHYEGDAVATRYLDGSWVGWTYWHGGGKHSEPDAIEWIDDAYDVICVEEQKMTTVRTFSKVA